MICLAKSLENDIYKLYRNMIPLVQVEKKLRVEVGSQEVIHGSNI